MPGEPEIDSLHSALAERERGVRRVLDLRHCNATNAGNDRELSAVKLSMRELFREKKQCRDRGGATKQILDSLFNSLDGHPLTHSFVFKQSAITKRGIPRIFFLRLREEEATESGTITLFSTQTGCGQVVSPDWCTRVVQALNESRQHSPTWGPPSLSDARSMSSLTISRPLKPNSSTIFWPIILTCAFILHPSSWPNQVEIWFAKIQRQVIAQGIFSSVDDLPRILRYIRHYNKTATSIKWTYSTPAKRINV